MNEDGRKERWEGCLVVMLLWVLLLGVAWELGGMVGGFGGVNFHI